jgi:glycine betaine/proline transport system substrate-binding protein
VLALTACGGGSVEEQTDENQAQAGGGDCGEFDILMHPWVGYTANAYVVGHVAEEELGCTVNYIELKEGGPSYQALASGDGDVILEEWSHEAELKQSEKDGTAVDLGSMGAVGVIGWYVPGWLGEEHPEVLDWQNLNDFADEFQTSESGDQGQFLGSDPTYTQYDEAIIKNLGLDFKVIFSGGETATVEAFEKGPGEQGVAHRLLLGAALHPRADPVLTGEAAALRGGLRRQQGGGRLRLRRNSPEEGRSHRVHGLRLPGRRSGREVGVDQRGPERRREYITADKMSPEEAAAKWVTDNKDKVEAWLG